MTKEDEITELREELAAQKIDRLRDRMKHQVRHRIQYGELYRSFAESVNEVAALKAELYEKTQLLQNYNRKKRKKKNLDIMGVHTDYDPPDYWGF